MYMTDEDRRTTAYHEAGHAIVTVLSPKADPLHKVTVIPRGMALGATMSLPERDRYGANKKELLARMRVCFGGRVAEELVCDDISSGAQNDIEQATELARMMVTKWGMSERVGPISLVEGEEHLFLGREVARSVDHSEETAKLIDEEIKRFLTNALEETRTMLSENMDAMHRVAEALLEYETLTGEEARTTRSRMAGSPWKATPTDGSGRRSSCCAASRLGFPPSTCTRHASGVNPRRNTGSLRSRRPRGN